MPSCNERRAGNIDPCGKGEPVTYQTYLHPVKGEKQTLVHGKRFLHVFSEARPVSHIRFTASSSQDSWFGMKIFAKDYFGGNLCCLMIGRVKRRKDDLKMIILSRVPKNIAVEALSKIKGYPCYRDDERRRHYPGKFRRSRVHDLIENTKDSTSHRVLRKPIIHFRNPFRNKLNRFPDALRLGRNIRKLYFP